MKIRDIVEGDRASIKAIVDDRLGPGYFEEIEEGTLGDGIHVCAVIDGKVVGYGVAVFYPEHALMQTLVVDKKHEGKGVGSALIKERLKRIKAAGCNMAIAHAWRSSKGCNVCALLEKHGFEAQCEILNYYQEMDAICPACPGVCVCSAIVYAKSL